MSNCSHSEEQIEFVYEHFWEAKVRCKSCGETFEVPGWGRRGTGKAFFDGITGGLRSLVGSTIGKKDD